MNQKIILMASALLLNGAVAAFNSKAIRQGVSPWWTVYIISIISSSVYAYQLKQNILPLTTASVFHHFFFHSSWYFVTIFVLNEHLTPLKGVGLILAFLGMLLMSVK